VCVVAVAVVVVVVVVFSMRMSRASAYRRSMLGHADAQGEDDYLCRVFGAEGLPLLVL
jgi:hypothetical protein